MNKNQKWIFALLRIALGWLIFYAGITKVFDPDWTSAGYLNNASTFPEFYAFLADPQILMIIDFLNAWGLTLVGAGLLAGVLVRYAAAAGALLMLLYYFPILNFPYVGANAYLVDEHIIYFLVLLLFMTHTDSHLWSLERPLKRIFRR